MAAVGAVLDLDLVVPTLPILSPYGAFMAEPQLILPLLCLFSTAPCKLVEGICV